MLCHFWWVSPGKFALPVKFPGRFNFTGFGVYRDLATRASKNHLISESDSLQSLVKSRGVASPARKMRVEIVVVS